MKILAILLVLIATIIGAFGSLFMKKGSKDFHYKLYKNIKNLNLIIGILLYVFSSLFYIAALKMGDVTLVYPMTSLSYIWVAFLSIIFLKEKINNLKLFGIISIITGVILITI